MKKPEDKTVSYTVERKFLDQLPTEEFVRRIIRHYIKEWKKNGDDAG